MLGTILGARIIGVSRGDIGLAKPEYVGKDPDYFMATILTLEDGRRLLFLNRRIDPFSGTEPLAQLIVDGEGEYKVLGHKIEAVLASESGQIFLLLDNGIFITVNDNDGYYMDLYSHADLSADPPVRLRPVAP